MRGLCLLSKQGRNQVRRNGFFVSVPREGLEGHFDLSMLELDGLAQDGLSELKVNMGIAIVVPVSKILEVLNQEELVEARKKQDEVDRMKKADTPDTTMR